MLPRYRVLIGLLVASPVLVAFSVSPDAVNQGGRVAWWWWVLIVLVLLVLLVWWWLGRRATEEAGPATKVETATPSHAVEAPTPVTEPALSKADDLKRVEGIGPKISGLLQAAGIKTFAQLAETDVGRLEQIVRQAGITIADPTTWPEQAALAAAGEWEKLEVLQDKLKGGRRA
jgi:predicted flap endonuclease-1-like 5' DNA nuclease